MKKQIFFFLLLLCFTSILSQNNYEISLITIAPGKDIYSAFGHSFLRVKNLKEKCDIGYNFGYVSQSDSTNTFHKFIAGTLRYKIGYIDNPELKIFASKMTKKSVTERVFNLDSIEQKKVITNIYNSFTKNAHNNLLYEYQFVNNNCTTQIRDILFNANQCSFYNNSHNNNNITYRKYFNKYLIKFPWYKMLGNLLLNSSVDQPISFYRLTFLPFYLAEVFDNTNIKKKPLISETITLAKINSSHKNSFKPVLSVLIICFFILVINNRYLDTIFKLLIGVLGAILLFYGLTSKHVEVLLLESFNFNLLWCNPLNLLLFFKCTKAAKSILYINNFNLALLAIAVAAYLFNFQYFEVEFLIILSTLILIHLRKNIRKVIAFCAFRF